mmetsp:Transcript_30926/g.69468  ORF Transcript_30926/g.69468 Transcript_30926/m.69468 type:complete len:487 (-) Transcript_30926:229-1689(-)
MPISLQGPSGSNSSSAEKDYKTSIWKQNPRKGPPQSTQLGQENSTRGSGPDSQDPHPGPSPVHASRVSVPVPPAGQGMGEFLLEACAHPLLSPEEWKHKLEAEERSRRERRAAAAAEAELASLGAPRSAEGRTGVRGRFLALLDHFDSRPRNQALYSQLLGAESGESGPGSGQSKADGGSPAGPADKMDNDTKSLYICLGVLLAIILFTALDSMTTGYSQKLAEALAVWTLENAPWSFVAYELVITLLVVACLPYGALAVLSGALFVHKYGTLGLFIAWIALFVSTLTGEFICFFLARYGFKDMVQRKVQASPKLAILRNLDRLIEDGQAIEMVMLIRLAPLPKGPSNYFLGTTAVSVRDFTIGSIVINLPMCLLDVSIGAGAGKVDKDSPVAIIGFVAFVLGIMLFVVWVGIRAKYKLEALEQRDKDLQASQAAGGTEGTGGAAGAVGGEESDSATKRGAPKPNPTAASGSGSKFQKGRPLGAAV